MGNDKESPRKDSPENCLDVHDDCDHHPDSSPATPESFLVNSRAHPLLQNFAYSSDSNFTPSITTISSDPLARVYIEALIKRIAEVCLTETSSDIVPSSVSSPQNGTTSYEPIARDNIACSYCCNLGHFASQCRIRIHHQSARRRRNERSIYRSQNPRNNQ